MKFKIIQNEQTPKIETHKNAIDFIKDNNIMIIKFLSFARRQHNCAGLAANQVALNGERIMERFFALKSGHFWSIMINPRILQKRGKKIERIEGCLTWIGKKIKAYRYPVLEVEFYTLKGEKVIDTISGLNAQIFQHELNHLDGVEEIFI